MLDRANTLSVLSILYSVWQSHILQVYFVKGMERNGVDSFTIFQLRGKKKSRTDLLGNNVEIKRKKNNYLALVLSGNAVSEF